MINIAAVCAFAPRPNTGMLTAELGLASFLGRFKEARCDWFNIEQERNMSSFNGTNHPLRQRLLTNAATLKEYDRVVYWGDFLHSRRYHEADIKGRFRDRAELPQIAERIYECLLLEGATADFHNKVICFGGALYINSTEDERDSRYASAIRQLYSNARLVLCRDPISAALAKRYGALDRADLLGVDCAFLLQAPASSEGIATRDSVGFAFGRALSKRPRMLARMQAAAKQLAEIMELPTVDLGWLDADGVYGKARADKKLASLRNCRVVVTDVYHCAVNAWREGIPAICFGSGAERSAGTLSDKKKELLYSMFNLRDHYIYAEWLDDQQGLAKEMERQAALLVDEARISFLLDSIRQAANTSESRLAESLR